MKLCLDLSSIEMRDNGKLIWKIFSEKSLPKKTYPNFYFNRMNNWRNYLNIVNVIYEYLKAFHNSF